MLKTAKKIPREALCTFSPRFKIKRRGLTKNFQDTMLNDVKRGIPNSINSSINIASRGSLSDPRASSPR